MADKLSKANSAILSIVSQHQEPFLETLPESKVETTHETIAVPPQQLESSPEVIPHPTTERPVETNTEPVMGLFMEPEANTTAELKAALSLNQKKQKMTERKKRVSYYFDPATIEMVDALASKTGWDKYEIVELAVKELYRQVIEK